MRYTTDNLPSADEIRRLLRQEVLEVTFKKRDGSERLMFCTLLPQYLPEPQEDRDAQEPNPDVITVHDLESDAWRCFRHDSIISIEHD